jgi:hypothetical protein
MMSIRPLSDVAGRCVITVVLGVHTLAPTAWAAESHGDASDCQVSAPSNGTGYAPPSNASSLPRTEPSPGPEILYRPLATSPQLENTGVWRAEPIMISGTRAYRDGEFVYQDFLYDDRALPYPDEPEKYARNAADLVEVRLKPLGRSLAIRLTYNSMPDPDVVASTIALGNSASPHPMPHQAGAKAPADVFVTVHGCTGDIVRAADGAMLAEEPTVTLDPQRRQVEVRVPYSAFDPRNKKAVRVAAAAGLWDRDAGRYQRPEPSRPAFYNVAFREYGAWTQNTWMDQSQNQALAAGDLSPLFATVDFTKLAARADDDMHGEPGGVPRSGPMNRLLVSHFEPAQGRGNDTEGGGAPALVGDFRCEPPGCTPEYSGRLQPYSVYVPEGTPPSRYGLVINLHGAQSNHNHFELGPPDPPLATWHMLAEGGKPSIMAMPLARGQSYFYHGLAAANVFEVWADVAAHYDLDPGFVTLTGSSMGGYGTYKFGVQYPDLFGALFPNVGPGGPTAAHVPPATAPAVADGEVWRMFEGLRHVPVLATQNANDPVVPAASTTHNMQTLHKLGYRYDYWYFTGVDGGAGHAEYRHYVREQYRDLQSHTESIDRNPRRVSYVLNQSMSEPRYSMSSDHAYWVSDLRARDADVSPPLANIDVVSHGIPARNVEPLPAESSAGNSLNGSGPYTRVLREQVDRGPTAVYNALDITARNISQMTIHVDRARIGCDAALDIDTDGPITVRLVGDRCERTLRAT